MRITCLSDIIYLNLEILSVVVACWGCSFNHHTTERCGDDAFPPSHLVAVAGNATHGTATVSDTATMVVLLFSGAQGLMRATGTPCHWQPNEAPEGLPIILAPPPPRHAGMAPQFPPHRWLFQINPKLPTNSNLEGNRTTPSAVDLQRATNQLPSCFPLTRQTISNHTEPTPQPLQSRFGKSSRYANKMA